MDTAIPARPTHHDEPRASTLRSSRSRERECPSVEITDQIRRFPTDGTRNVMKPRHKNRAAPLYYEFTSPRAT
eukprot:3063800-Prymnesium_polylepis.1